MAPHDESGDLLGFELLLGETPEGLAGALTMAEGAPTSPYALLNPRIVSDSLTFQIDWMGRTDDFVVTFHGDSARIRSAHSPAEMLGTRQNLSQYFRSERTRRCD